MVYGQIFSRFLDTNGDGTGTKNAIGDYSAGEEFYIQPPNRRVFLVARMLVQISDDAILSADKYGGIAELTNGIEIKIKDDAGTIVDLTDGIPIRHNADWGHLCYDVVPINYGAGNNHIAVRWTFEKSGAPIKLEGSMNERLVIELSDDLTGLVDHTFMVQGRDGNRVA